MSIICPIPLFFFFFFFCFFFFFGCPSFCSVGLLGSKLVISAILSRYDPSINKCLVKSLKKWHPVIAEKWAFNAANGGPAGEIACLCSIYGNKRASQCQPSHFYSQAQMRPCCLHPLDAPTHLPLSRPFC